MQFFIKLLISVSIIIFCTQIGRSFPSLAGLVATMPLTGAVVLIWLYSDNKGDFPLMENYAKGALWGILPSIMFFIVAYICFSKKVPISITLLSSFGVWLVGAFVHQLILR
jgi:uncharacterized membrane protein (GlpM family)